MTNDPTKPVRAEIQFKSQEGKWPLVHHTDGFPYRTHFVIQKIDTMGNKAIAYTVEDHVHAVDSRGEEYPNWPVDLNQIPGPNTPGNARQPVVGDIDNDDDMEIMVLFSRSISYNSVDFIAAWHLESATLVDGWPVLLSRDIEDLALGDIDNDRDLEVLASRFEVDNNEPAIFAYQGNGKLVDNWPAKALSCSSWHPNFHTFCLGDLNHDGNMESVTLYGYEHNSSTPHCLVAIYDKQGELDHQTTVNKTITNAGLCDLDKDPDLEIAYTCYRRKPGGVFEGNVNAINQDGSFVPRWENQASEKGKYYDLAIGDLNLDGKDDIVVHSFYGVKAYDFTGTLLWKYHDIGPDSNLVLADIWGDPCPEVIYGARRGVVALTNKGKLVFHHETNIVSNELENWVIAVDDLDNDGDLEFLSWSYTFHNPESIHYFFAWDLDHKYAPGSLQWPMYRHDAQHTGCFDPK